MQDEIDDSLNVLGEPLKPCSFDPMTGFFRDGCCNTGPADRGRHTVCVRLTAEFLAFSRRRGNDLSTPRPEFGFAGLQAGRPLVPLRRPLGGGARPPAPRRRWCSPAPTARCSTSCRSRCCGRTPCRQGGAALRRQICRYYLRTDMRDRAA